MPRKTQPDEHRQAELARALTDRDRAVIASLGDHRVMTTRHLHALHFHNVTPQRSWDRLLALHRWGVLDRFRPYLRWGAVPFRWVLAADGEHVYARIRGLDEPAQRPGSRIALAHSAKLGHILGLSETYAAFATAARTTPGAHLEVWRTEAECARLWGRHIRPDAYLRWIEGDTAVEAFLEYDNGTEGHHQVARKLRGYADHAAAYQRTNHVLFVVPTHTREERLSETLAARTGGGITVHLTTPDLIAAGGAASAIWRPAGDDYRTRLADIAT
ncbi:replication-relaxation family protein [Nocardiopsis chromatogenes]|uniref:replication-relaxation family protein n=1 Tax=Nocardiopsis chromatogenes TaxID=280239 RepID=UPI000347A987|nr:replication-relaxation family protein [Nocardiopsis chromatogenes]